MALVVLFVVVAVDLNEEYLQISICMKSLAVGVPAHSQTFVFAKGAEHL